MTTVHLVGGERVAYVKGAAEVVLPRTTLSRGAQPTWPPPSAMERDALRVLALARRVLPAEAATRGRDRADLEFLGLVGMIDPPRPRCPDAIRRCRERGSGSSWSPATAAAPPRRSPAASASSTARCT